MSARLPASWRESVAGAAAANLLVPSWPFRLVGDVSTYVTVHPAGISPVSRRAAGKNADTGGDSREYPVVFVEGLEPPTLTLGPSYSSN